jgi:hypothetical protein
MQDEQFKGITLIANLLSFPWRAILGLQKKAAKTRSFVVEGL